MTTPEDSARQQGPDDGPPGDGGPEAGGGGGGASRVRTVIVSLLVLAAATGVAAITFLSEPTAKRGGATKETAMLVEVIRVARANARPVIVATGVVQAEQDVVLRPQVSGEVIGRSPEFTPGGFVEAGATLLRIEPADYRNVLRQRKSALRQALAELQIEMGRQQAAKSGYELLDEQLPDQRKALVLRAPQLDAAKVKVEAARVDVAQAELDLRRTTIKAPFSAQIITREVNVGSQVSASDRLGRLVGVDEYWVMASVPLAKLRWLTFPGAGGEGSSVRVRNRSAWPAGSHRTGRLHKLIGALDEQTRMARVLVTVVDPLARRPGAQQAGQPPLMVGEFVEVRIRGKQIDNVVRLARDYLREGDTTWVMKDQRLRIRELDIVARDKDHAYVARGLDDGDRVVTTNLATVTEGARLRLQGADKQPAAKKPAASAAATGDAAGPAGSPR